MNFDKCYDHESQSRQESGSQSDHAEESLIWNPEKEDPELVSIHTNAAAARRTNQPLPYTDWKPSDFDKARSFVAARTELKGDSECLIWKKGPLRAQFRKIEYHARMLSYLANHEDSNMIKEPCQNNFAPEAQLRPEMRSSGSHRSHDFKKRATRSWIKSPVQKDHETKQTTRA